MPSRTREREGGCWEQYGQHEVDIARQDRVLGRSSKRWISSRAAMSDTIDKGSAR